MKQGNGSVLVGEGEGKCRVVAQGKGGKLGKGVRRRVRGAGRRLLGALRLAEVMRMDARVRRH